MWCHIKYVALSFEMRDLVLILLNSHLLQESFRQSNQQHYPIRKFEQMCQRRHPY